LDELVQAKWRDFDAEAKTLRLPKTKGNKSRTISLSDPALAHTLGTVRVLGSDVIFCHDTGLAYANASSNFAQICRRIEKVQPSFKRFRFHDLRTSMLFVLCLMEWIFGHSQGNSGTQA